MATNQKTSLLRLQCSASTLALLATLAVAAGSAHAQTGLPSGAEQQAPNPVADGPQAGGATVQDVVVTGFRASLQSAINTKRQESGVVDVIKAEDIADFPDNNLAESIQRIPGVSITRSAGEGRNITVRGLGPGSTRVRINGMEGLSTTGASDADGGANRARQFDFNVFASELFNSIAVRKTSQASVEEGSLGATVDLQTSRPFDFRGDALVASAQYGYNDLSETWDPRFAILGSKRFMDDTLGALISVAYSNRTVREEGFNTVRWDHGGSQNGFCSPVGVTPQNRPTSAATGTNAANCFAGDPRLPNTPQFVEAYNLASATTSFHPRLPRYARLDYDQERLGVTGSLQWRPTDRTQISFDVLYSKYGSNRTENYLEGIALSRSAGAPEFGKAFVSVREYEVDDYGSLVYGVFDNMDIRIESRFDEITTEFTQYTLSGTHELSDRLRVSGLIGTSESDFSNPIQTTITLDRANQDGWIYDARATPHAPNITWGFDVTDPNAYTFTNANATGTIRPSEIRLRPQYVLNTFDLAAGDLEYDIDDSVTFKTGFTLKKFVNDGREYRRATEFDIPALPAGTTMEDITTQLTGFGKNFDGENVPTGWVIPNFDAIAEALDIYSNTGTFELLGIEQSNARGSWRTIEEASKAAYIQVDFNWRDQAIPIRGDMGLRFVETTTTASGYQFANATPVAVTVENTYENLLPSANVAAEITPDFLVRASAAMVMVRPGLGALNPGGNINTGSGNLAITAGNPYLEPQRANTYDLSFEWYPAANTIYALGFFYKDFKVDTTSVRLSGPFNSFGLPLELLDGTGRLPTDSATYTTTINAPGGNPLKGFELNIQQSFAPLAERWGLPEWTGGFGVLFNYTYVKGSSLFCIQTVNGNCTQYTENDPTGVSKNAGNATVYFENDKLSVRVSAAYRDRYLFNVPGASAGNLLGTRREYQDADFVPASTVVDFSASYNLTEKIKLSVEGLNLTDEPNQQFNDTEAQRVWTNHHTGRQFYFGVRYAF